METFISILRGINVSGHKMIKMKALQELYETLGFCNVKTYIQSGNVIFASVPMETGKLEKLISEGIMQLFGFEVPVIVMERGALKNVSANNLFISKRGEDITKLHVTFLSMEPEKNLVDKIRKEEYFPDEFYTKGRAVYLYCPQGYGNTKLSNTFFEKKLQVQATTRNWKTVLELVKMAE
jgi:uncharacterized protein (DUF1697 family)